MKSVSYLEKYLQTTSSWSFTKLYFGFKKNSTVGNAVSFLRQIKLQPRPGCSPILNCFKISDRQPHLFTWARGPPPTPSYFVAGCQRLFNKHFPVESRLKANPVNLRLTRGILRHVEIPVVLACVNRY